MDTLGQIEFVKSKGYKLLKSTLIRNISTEMFVSDIIVPMSIGELEAYHCKEKLLWWDSEEKHYYESAFDICELLWEDYEEYCKENWINKT